MMNSTQASLYEGQCRGCGSDFFRSRTDQIYCTPRCKNQYHNGKSRVGRLATKERQEITKKVDDILWKNREVLLKYEKEVSLEELEKKGFRSGYISQFKLGKSENENTFYIYDVAYVFIDSKTIKILNHGK